MVGPRKEAGDPPAGEDEVRRIRGLPGCGMAAYAVLLLLLCLVGLAGMVGAVLLALRPGGQGGPSPLQAGSEVAVWRLQPMRDAGLLKLTEVPDAYHDESASLDGTKACALSGGRVLRLAEGQGTAIPYAEIASVEEKPDDGGRTVVVKGQGKVASCRFRKGEGGDRFARQIRSEAVRAGAPLGAPATDPLPGESP